MPQCVHALHSLNPAKFILVDGATAIIRGHSRVTRDVDILVHDIAILEQLKIVNGFKVVDGKLSVSTKSESRLPIPSACKLHFHGHGKIWL